MIWDRLGVITDEVSQHLGEALDWAAANGLKHVEIRMIGGRNVMELSDEEADGVRRETEARGLFVSCLASPVFKCSLDPARPAAAGDTFGQEEQSVQAHFAKGSPSGSARTESAFSPSGGRRSQPCTGRRL
ncbi:hypothetical protein [Paenibacillus sp. H1-7]|uniref:hypothetical protein n=1 Tax=Paenibacillus sp. H1-7 TaxID=2282849 RepID=UPI001EF7B44A|nr:hypothetical protein [Paenibacillus sp. H1-7]